MMGVFSRFYPRKDRRSPQTGTQRENQAARAPDGAELHLLEGAVPLNVVGESHYQENILKAIGARRPPNDPLRVDVHGVLLAETDNPFDEYAISVWVNGLKVGHLSRDHARMYRQRLLDLERRVGKPIALLGSIAGGGMRENGPGLLGVFLRHDPSVFGFKDSRHLPTAEPRVRTGFTAAIAADEADDSYDLAWVNELPEDPIRAISILRSLLAVEEDPMDRHFMFHHLETALYRSRDAFDSALDEYDECCRQHDAEMENISAVLMAKWGQIPWLHTYKQMCIRLAKAKRFNEALRWAQRGLAIYGDNAARADAVEDLRRRAAAYRAKLTPSTAKSTRPERPKGPETEILRCAKCAQEFQRLRTRGRKPTLCPDCRAETG